NFIEPMEGSRTGQNIPHLKESLERIATGLRIPVDRLRQRLEESRGKLFEARRERAHPGKDDKVLTDWNGLMIAAMAKAGRVLDEPAYVEAARGGAEFVLGRMRKEDGRLLHRYREGEAGIEGNLDDYAFLVWGLIELYEAEFEVGLLRTALALNGLMLADFWDEKEGGLFFAAEGAESLLVRQKQVYDGAVPSGNSVAMLNLLRLGRITANSDFEVKADRLARAFGSDVERLPAAYTQLLVAIDFGIGPTFELTVAGKKEAEDTQRMLRTVHSKFVPNKVVIHRPSGEDEPEIARFAEFVKNQTTLDDHATAYVCVNYACQEPTTDPERVVELLESRSP
ncbi:MAG: thioredoxin domain-containing protein, partial [Phycisphaerae bacterium]|nr:thioredoxin domain-containing protein [Phycisphaerae bacterium]